MDPSSPIVIGESGPYFKCSITPTVVSNFNLPNSNVNKDGPYLQIVEQPQTKFRFRYQSEMVGTHGQLKAESSNKTKNIYPTIKLQNWNGGSALIKLMLYTADGNVNDRKQHVHQLHGKNFNKDGMSGGYEVVVDETNDYTAQFPNLGIIHIAKRDVPNIICARKKEELINYARIANPNLRNESIQHNISPTELTKIKNAADEEAKNMNLNKVVLRFQAFFYDQKLSCYGPITDFVDSGVIFNLKNASTGELKIVRMSAASASCAGGTEVWMLVEKVNKGKVKIKFFELDEEGNEIWRSNADFKDSDVHHQYAIVFKTPAYHDTNLREPKQVKVQLERTTDNDTSEPHDFTFTPENLKRKNNMLLDQHFQQEYNAQKRPKTSLDIEPIDLKIKVQNEAFFLESSHPYETPKQSPSQIVPSSVVPADSPGSYIGIYSPDYNGPSGTPIIAITKEEPNFILMPMERKVGSPSYFENAINLHGENQTNGYANPGHISPSYNPQGSVYAITQQNPCSSPSYHRVPSPSYGQRSPMYGTQIPSPSMLANSPYANQNSFIQATNPTETALSQIEQFDAYQKDVILSKNRESPMTDELEFSELLNNSPPLPDTEDTDLLSILTNDKFFVANDDIGDIQTDGIVVAKKGETEQDIDSLTDKMAAVTVNVSQSKQTESDPSFKIAMKAVQQLSSYFVAPQDNVHKLLETHKYLLAAKNDNGDSLVHKIICTKNIANLKRIIQVLQNLNCQPMLFGKNFCGETPLHLALKLNQLDMVKELIKVPGTNLESTDADGNSAIHLASALSTDHLKTLLSHHKNGFAQSIKKSINEYNYDGQASLHIAVRAGILGNVLLLINSGALVHQCERKQGANPLHLSVMNGNHAIAKYLVQKTSITVDASLLNGDTALHIAARAKDFEMCSILMAGKADPLARNRVIKKGLKNYPDEEDEDEDSSDDEENEENYCTPIDYAEGDQQLLDLLQKEIV